MSVDALALALMATEDPANRAAIAAGDLSCLADADLSEEELALLTGASNDDPEVVGFTFAESPTFRALDYVRINQDYLAPQIRVSFTAYAQITFGGTRAAPCNNASAGTCGRTT